MDPSHYHEYSTIYDYFSDDKLFPPLKNFIVDVVAPNLKPHAHVADIGGGTGLFSSMLLEHSPTTQLTIIEPSTPMLAIAKKRLGNRVRYCHATIEEALPTLHTQDAFIFQRSLYAIYKNESHCKKLFYELNRKLAMGGSIFISDFKHKYNPEEMKKYLLAFFDTSEQERINFLSKWPILLEALLNFNAGVDCGRFHLFTEHELDSILRFSCFKNTYTSGESQYAYKKIAGCYKPFWLHQLLHATI